MNAEATTTETRVHPYRDFLAAVSKPARYAGGEIGARRRTWTDDVAKICLAFPDVYDIGMSHLGFKILYKILNDDERTLAERCYTPWVDMEAELRKRDLPLVSLESYRPLCDFDVIGFSLQYELTYTNILTMLDLGRIPLRSTDRGETDPLVIAGGPVATHPEPLTPFVDAIVIGDGEQKATEVALLWKKLSDQGVARIDRLRALAKLGAVYVPSLYDTELDPDTGLNVVVPKPGEHVPMPVDRALVDLDDYPFPDDSPTGGPEAIFDRMSIEIARGCTEGCRFCQAGMIYRPVRERDPEQIVDTVMSAIDKSGQDEVSLTALSTADVSCISPLIKKVADRLTERRVSLSVSSLRAYGLEPELLDELGRVRAAGLTFAPEAGSQRMRDVVNKNVTEDQLLETAERVFTRGHGKMKLYFMIGLPTETDEDVCGTVETGVRALDVGKQLRRDGKIKGRPPEVTVSVSTHVPKPHTPFQWCAMDTLDEVARKQQLLRTTARPIKNLKLRTHDADSSVLEGIMARGDRPLADVIEHAWRAGARFDSWDEQVDLSRWQAALEHYDVDTSKYLGTLPVTARLPWDHIDVGLEDGFLAKEYRKALKSRLSPPCGKAAGQFVHHTNVEDANADGRRLVCYDCGVACDMTQMRAERVTFLKRMGADTKAGPSRHPKALPMVADDEGKDPKLTQRTPAQARRPGGPPTGVRHRFRFEKLGPMALLGHLDLIRELPRSMRRGGLVMEYTKGFHPKPDMTFAPALPLGVPSLDEYVDIRLDRAITAQESTEVLDRINASCPEGLRFVDVVALGPTDPTVSRRIGGAAYLLVFSRASLADDVGVAKADLEAFLEGRIAAALAAEKLPMRRDLKGLAKYIDARPLIRSLSVVKPTDIAGWPRIGLVGDLVGVRAEMSIEPSGAVKPIELAAIVAGDGVTAPHHHAIRTALLGRDDRGLMELNPPPLARGADEAALAGTA